jgi:hypothetical protein
MKEKKARVEDALHACRAAVEEGILPGGGVSVIRAARKSLDSASARKPPTRSAPGRRDRPPGGRSPDQADRRERRRGRLRRRPEGQGKHETNFGYNALTHEYGDLLKMGVIVPTKVERTALQNAASIASLLLTTDAIVSEIKEDKPEPAGAPGGGMVHLLARFADDQPRHWIGRAKLHASHLLRQQGLRTESGGLWGKRSYARPIVDREHQIKVFRYILAHEKRGAATWKFVRPSKADG